MLRLYESPLSGNSYKIRLLLSHLDRDYQRVTLDLLAGDARAAEFLAKNPQGRVPVLELEDGSHLAESNAILCYLARATPYLPDDPIAAAKVLRWMFFEQNTLEPPLAGARFLLRFSGKTEANESVSKRQLRAKKALDLMELHMSVRPYFTAGRYTIADIALYAYAHVAPQAGIDLAGYPHLEGWMQRVVAQPGYIPIEDDYQAC